MTEQSRAEHVVISFLFIFIIDIVGIYFEMSGQSEVVTCRAGHSGQNLELIECLNGPIRSGATF